MLDLFYSTDSLQKQMEEGHRFIIAMNDKDALGFASWSLKPGSSSVYRLHKIYIDIGNGFFMNDYVMNLSLAED